MLMTAYFHSQLLAVAKAACFALVRSGNVSPVKIQIPGAHVEAYPRMNKHADTIMRFPMPAFCPSAVGVLAVPAAAKTKSHAACHRPPMMSGLRRPKCSCETMSSRN